MNGKTLRDIPTDSYLPATLGPLIEFLFLLSAGDLPNCADGWLSSISAQGFLTAWNTGSNRWLSPDGSMGLISTNRSSSIPNGELTAFLMAVQRSAREISHLPGTTPGQMAAAMQELESNVQEHSNSPGTGILVFRATSEMFEFVVADRGMGVLTSLRQNDNFSALNDYGSALASALTDGNSRYDDPKRGHGFRPIFLGLTNLQGYLRFRSGDHALVMDGTGPSLASAQLSQKPFLKGFFASISCRTDNGNTSNRLI